MKNLVLKVSVLLLVLALVVSLTLATMKLLNPLVFWVLAGISAVFAFKILPKIKQ
ncbi:MAG: hypothetical protein WC634_02815 [archaeon]